MRYSSVSRKAGKMRKIETNDILFGRGGKSVNFARRREQNLRF